MLFPETQILLIYSEIATVANWLPRKDGATISTAESNFFSDFYVFANEGLSRLKPACRQAGNLTLRNSSFALSET
jgi:hypothetical protein